MVAGRLVKLGCPFSSPSVSVLYLPAAVLLHDLL
jgi:hypothetical protein